MQYRKDKYGNDISALGYGCMRFTTSGGKADLDKAEKEIMTAFEAGVNYYDTAYVYSGNEVALGTILQRTGIRDRIKIATKLPHYRLKDGGDDPDRFFLEELKRLQTDHVDYYLMHMLNDVAAWERLVRLGIIEWIEKKKESGQIRQIGFSYHGNSDDFCGLLDAYDWDFCQIQYNYLDETSQAGVTGLAHAREKGVPVVIMEPLRGGRLVNGLPRQAVERFRKADPDRSPAEWGLRWLWDQEGITCVLSGMNSLEMVRENVRIAGDCAAGSLTEEDREVFADVCRIIRENELVGCTGCRYCMPCPKGVDIPGVFSVYNRLKSEGKYTALREYMKNTCLRHDFTGAGNCVGCGKCEQHCPQHIQIRKELENVRKKLEGPVFKIAKKGMRLMFKY
ncbi:MAG: aldo/keto reductase [Lachnospiraceae bacterium]|nr:aldo/keto reductase [Lachnospiraceae bacterium]